MEGSFADTANNHGFKRSRWRRLWRQQIQDWLIAAIQNLRILLKKGWPKLKAATALPAEVIQLSNQWIFKLLFVPNCLCSCAAGDPPNF